MSQRSTQILSLIQKHGLRVFSTADFLTLTGQKHAAASQSLHRFEQEGLVERLSRGIWVNKSFKNIHPYEAVAHLVPPWPSYVSLYSALSDYGLVAEIPHTIYAVTSGRNKRTKTSLGTYQFHHLPSRFMWGFEMRRVGEAVFPMAEREKAFLDHVYLALIPRSPIQLPQKREKDWGLESKRLKDYARQFEYPPMLAYLSENRLI